MVQTDDQEQAFDTEAYAAGVADSLGQGRFRIVLAPDEAPDELVRLVGYLQTISDHLLIDLVTVAAYQIDSSKVLVPQRVDPERQSEETPARPARPVSTGKLTEGSSVFTASLELAPAQAREDLRRLVHWAESLEKRGLVQLYTYEGKGRWTLLPWLPTERVGMVTIWNDHGVSLSLWRSVFERRAPNAVGQGNTIKRFDDDFLNVLTEAYQEAARLGALQVPQG